MYPGLVRQLSLLTALSLLFILASCGGGGGQSSRKATQADICNCIPSEPTAKDYRHDAKHVPLPSIAPVETDVSVMLSRAQGAAPAFDAPRSGRELVLFHIARAYLQSAYINTGDCDMHFEISSGPDPNAPRVIVETPGDPEYCTARQHIQAQLATRGFSILGNGSTISPALPVSVLGLAFHDYEHNRGSAQVATTWELHPAVVTVIP